jgi:hypothetical protein
VQKSPLDFSDRQMFLAELNFQLSTAILVAPYKSIHTKFPSLANTKRARWISPAG